jgi:retron-type reverse transcriptase
MMNDGSDWVVDIDLEKFFDTVNHDKLMTLIGRTIKDGDVISIVRKFLVSGIMMDDEYKESVIGTPQGGNLSPLLANIMLNELDREMEQRGLNFVRYADYTEVETMPRLSFKHRRYHRFPLKISA